jgi:hypothetical protein
VLTAIESLGPGDGGNHHRPSWLRWLILLLGIVLVLVIYRLLRG